jgi:hypothetical protein
MLSLSLRKSAAMWAVPFLLGLAAIYYGNEVMGWRFEYARAVDRCGLYLFIAGPVMAALVAWETWNERRRLLSLVGWLPHPWLVRFKPWVGAIAWFSLAHVVVLAVYLVTAWAAGAVGRPPVLGIVVQFAGIVGYVSLGAAVGWWAKSAVAAPVLGALLALANMEVGFTYRVRNVTELGTGVVDQLGMRLSFSHALLQLVCFAGLALVVWPLRRRRSNVQAVAVAGVLAAVVAAGLTTRGQDFRFTQDTSDAAPRCSTSLPRVCGPAELGGAYDRMSQDLRAYEEPLRAAGVSPPAAYRIATLGLSTPEGVALSHGQGIITLGPELLHDAGVTRSALVFAAAEPQTCDDGNMTSGSQISLVVALRATMLGWLAYQLRFDAGHQYPSDIVWPLEKLPLSVQRSWVAATYPKLWACSPAGLSIPPGVAKPSWLS